MGLIAFKKEAGARLLGRRARVLTKAASALKLKFSEEKTDGASAKRLEETIRDLDLEVHGLKVKIYGNSATITGIAFDSSTKEKIVLVVGNSKGIAEVDDQMTVEHVEPEAQFHTVINGDSLSKISKKYYGSSSKHPEIFEANKPMLSNPDMIYPGQVLRIPDLG
ncbi:peptidoglycan-binding protein LysM [Mangrovimonas aestuarii]|uniref:peptidoglycan-binding protein LysM n=1 Tax=Mangrovimonas aestuarii TaxID=3018443 RepID=UPI0023788181|nr:peptidoglycan-binding protein LysM [Mangrovimonas aestuarii]